jgi:molecular chaperone HtpG
MRGPGVIPARRIPFKVDIAGVIELLGGALYSRPEAAIRELIQNAHDAIMRRRLKELGYKGRIDVDQNAEASTLSVSDDGIGLTADEAETYLSTLGIGITGILRGRGASPSAPKPSGAGDLLIGQFGIGLFSAFLLADRMVVESLKAEGSEPVRWEAGAGSEILLSPGQRDQPGTTVTLHLKAEHRHLAAAVEPLEAAIKEFADFLPVPIFVNRAQARANVIHASWFEPTPDREAIELELEADFGETPLDTILIHRERPAALVGALYVTPRRTPGFAGEAVVTATVRRMVISRKIQGLLPEWAPFLRGVLELGDCSPTLSREDLVRDAAFQHAREELERLLFEHFERLAIAEPIRWEAILAWHRYTLAGAALSQRRLRDLLAKTYRWPTSQGPLTFDEIVDRSAADPILEADFERVLWFNADRRQERWANSLFAEHEVPCVHALRSFEESLLATMAADRNGAGAAIDLRLASPGSPNFAAAILGATDLDEVPERWREFLGSRDATIACASFREDVPIMAFLNERAELSKTFEELKLRGAIPSGFQRMIDTHLERGPAATNEVLLNRNHKLVSRALEQSTTHPLACVLRLLVGNALTAAGASPTRETLRRQEEDLDWIAETLWRPRA